MDRPSNNVPDLFPRGSTPPPDPGFQRQQQQYNNPQPHAPPTNSIDSLFHGLNPPATQQQHPLNLPPPPSNTFVAPPAYHPPQPAPAPAPRVEEAMAPPTNSAQSISSDRDRQTALLSLLGTVSSPGSQPRQAPPLPTSQATNQIPTPPAGANNNEAQGKLLLDQIMSGGAPRSNYPDTQQRNPLPGPSPPYVRGSPPTADDGFHSREAPYNPHETPTSHQQAQLQDPPSQQQQPPPHPPSPARKSMFEFMSPFDALAGSGPGTGVVKKKPLPQPGSISSSTEDSWTNASLSTDPKRKSVENLIDQLSRGQAPTQASAVPYDVYSSAEELSQAESGQSRGPMGVSLPSLASKPPGGVSPRVSPPNLPATRPQGRLGDSPLGQAGKPQPSNPLPSIPGRRDNKDSSQISAPRGGWKSDGRGRGTAPKGKNGHGATSPQPQTIVVDVSQQLDEIQAPPESVKSTAIALVKQDSVFLSGTTIGATHWVAYAMTRGRVRVISRSSGDRTLLQLPPAFSPSSAVTDMATFGNRLAGVTSDGGFVVWELPKEITDDVPGQVLLCILPSTTSDSDALHSVKWHPKLADTLAVASNSTIYLVDLVDASRVFRRQSISESELHRISRLFSVSSRVVAFDFDPAHEAIAAISEDSTLTMWNIRGQMPSWTQQIHGEELPSSLTFVDGGIIIGRKNGTIFQLLSMTTKSTLSTIKFINETEDPGMFGHVNYDSRIQTLWVANNRRDSMIALRLGLEGGVSDEPRVYLDQVVEFTGPKATIHFVILTADADPHGDEAHAACVAAKVPPSELALVAFSVHSSGVDQILIRKEWYDAALSLAPSKFPSYVTQENKSGRQGPGQQQQLQQSQHHPSSPALASAHLAAVLGRPRTPPSEDPETDLTRDEGRTESSRKGKAKSAGWKDKDEKGKETKTNDAALIGESALGQALSREIRKTEESLHTRIGRLIAKEMDKQHQRLEDARTKEQAEEVARQEKILKLISTELTRNTTRVVEMAVKSEVQNSVLPALESITHMEVKAALNDQIGRGLADFIQQSLPLEIEKLLLRPDIANHFAHILTVNLTPLMERNIKDAMNKTFLPLLTQQTTAMHQELLRELRADIHAIKNELFAVQADSARGHESLIRDLEHTVRALSDQVKFLSMNTPSVLPLHTHHMQQRGSPGPNSQHAGNQHSQGGMTQMPLRQLPVPQGTQNYGQNFQQQQPQAAPPPHSAWFSSGIAAPQASHPAVPPPPPPATQSHSQRTPPAQQEEWDDTYLAVLGTQDPRQLRELLSRSNPEVVMPLGAPSPLSQAVILTLLHRLAGVVGETPPVDEAFKSSLWWLQRTASALNTNDALISPYIARVVPNVQSMLQTTKQRLSIIPGGPQLLDTVRTISEVQDTLTRKPL